MYKKLFGLVGMLIPLFAVSSEHNGFVLIANLYNEKREQRAQEYIDCLQYNLANPLIEKIHIIYDTTDDDAQSTVHKFLTEHSEITVEYYAGRPSYGQMFDCASQWYKGLRILVSNGDIYFNETLAGVAPLDLTRKVLALGRWNVTPKGDLQIATEQLYLNGELAERVCLCSQDVWIFDSPLLVPANDIYIGTPHCDHYIASRLMDFGYELYNPSHDVQCCHLHVSQIRHNMPGGKHIMTTAAVPSGALIDVGNPKCKAFKTSYSE